MSKGLKKGDRVGHIHKDCDGTVTGVLPPESGAVDTQPWIAVKWDDGIKSTYAPSMLDLIWEA